MANTDASFADRLRAAAMALAGTGVTSGAADLLRTLGYDDGDTDATAGRIRLLRSAAQFRRLFRLPVPDAPGLTFFGAEGRRFYIEAYKHAIRIWTIVLEISVLMASFPSEEIARLSYVFRTLGLGYANLGAMLMQADIPYDSQAGREICAALSAILTVESYATSAEMARELGAFAGD